MNEPFAPRRDMSRAISSDELVDSGPRSSMFGALAAGAQSGTLRSLAYSAVDLDIEDEPVDDADVDRKRSNRFVMAALGGAAAAVAVAFGAAFFAGSQSQPLPTELVATTPTFVVPAQAAAPEVDVPLPAVGAPVQVAAGKSAPTGQAPVGRVASVPAGRQASAPANGPAPAGRPAPAAAGQPGSTPGVSVRVPGVSVQSNGQGVDVGVSVPPFVSPGQAPANPVDPAEANPAPPPSNGPAKVPDGLLDKPRMTDVNIGQPAVVPVNPDKQAPVVVDKIDSAAKVPEHVTNSPNKVDLSAPAEKIAAPEPAPEPAPIAEIPNQCEGCGQ